MPTQAQLAKHFGQSQPYINRLVKMGMPTRSFAAADEWVKKKNDAGGTGDNAPKTLNDARLKKTLLECERIRFALDVEKRRYILTAIVEEMWITAMTRVRAVTQKIVSDPPNWAGLSPQELSKRGQEVYDEICRELSDADAY